MSDQQIKKTREENEAEQEKQEESNAPYNCSKCGDPIKFHFVLKFIRESGLCPWCFNE